MSLWQNINGTWRKGTLWQNINGTWRRGVLWQNINGVWKKAEAAGGAGIAATADPNNTFGSVNRSGSGRVYTNATFVTASGGQAPYTYAWGGQIDWQVDAPTAASTRFSSVCMPGDDKTATFTCTVTDSLGKTATVDVTAEVANFYSGGNNAQIQ